MLIVTGGWDAFYRATASTEVATTTDIFIKNIFSSILPSLLANTDLTNVANPGVQLQPGRRVETGGFSHILKNF